jgi:signal peptidase I
MASPAERESSARTEKHPLPLILKFLIVTGGLALVLCTLFTVRFIRRSGLLRPANVHSVWSDAMCPTICGTESITVDMSAYTSQPIARGDVVWLVQGKPPMANVRRVVGIGGDTVSANADGTFLVNGEPIPPVPPACGTPKLLPQESVASFPPFVVPAGQVFVLGDNRGRAMDSRVWHGINVQDVRGKAVAIYSSPAGDRVGCKVQ